MRQSFPAKSAFNPDRDIPDLTGQVIIVTGANVGIGYETAKQLLKHNAKVYVGARSEEKATKAIASLKEQTGKEAVFLRLDLADLPSIKSAVEEFTQKETQLHVLFNNGGVMVPPLEQLTSQGYDLQFGTNVLGHFYFTKLLLPTLISTAAASPSKTARVINTGSFASYLRTSVDFNTVKESPARKRLGVQKLYAQSKFGNAIFSTELQRRYGDQGIVSIALNPGNIQSDLQRHLGSFAKTLMDKTILYPTPYGALTQLWAGTTDAGLSLGGKFVVPWARLGPTPAGSDDQAHAKAVWTWLEEQVANV
ncbi:NAD(P)-binding protein [Mycena chlorophos]|uniref:NAD(P)-binding protein n=1 Tax=Mycena chlorophos TaxID=658473 RepID=A0A8H6RY66_MYCCL|nr:NAD(P)-binding protein [Mycena chlorophos]